MLKVLRSIVHEINSAKDFRSSLNLLVSRVREVIETQACSIFLIDSEHAEFVLMATDGLNASEVGKLCFPLNTGLVGQVGLRAEPLNIEDAHLHPDNYAPMNLGEEKFHAFLGVPIIYLRQLQGVLILQSQEKRKFDEAEEAFLITIAAQLAGKVAHANSTGSLREWMTTTTNLAHSSAQKNLEKTDFVAITGVPTVPGVAIGQAVVVYPQADLDAVPHRTPDSVEAEIRAFYEAVELVRKEFQMLSERMRTILPRTEHALFDVYERVLYDTVLASEIVGEIRAGDWAQGALATVMKHHIAQFAAMEDPYLRERSDDFRDLGLRVLAQLQMRQQKSQALPEKVILVGQNITPAHLAEFPRGTVLGILSGSGSVNAHVAILAKALGVPTIMGAAGQGDFSTLENHTVVLDGYYGQVYVDPSPKLLKQYAALAEEEKELDANLRQLQSLPAQTPDGHTIALCVNAGLEGNTGLPLCIGADGVGLFRTEIPFMSREHFPVEEEQRVIYRQLLKAFAPRPVIMRTLDIGGDKPLPYFPIKEENPFLGWRGIRMTLDHPDIFLVQIRAMLKASVSLNNLRIMLPMVSQISEIDEALRLIHKAWRELIEEGLSIELPPVGIMVEVPSVIYQIAAIAKKVDFFSVGTNDLIQYLLAVDRNNPRVANLYDNLHPAVLMALQSIVKTAHEHDKLVSICGEMAGDPIAVIPLLGMGFDALSMNAPILPRIKWVIRNFTRARAKEILTEILEMDDPVRIRFHLEQTLEQAGLGGLIRAGK